MHCVLRVTSTMVAILAVTSLAGAEWTRFRGPDGSGVSEEKGLPTVWNAQQGVVWKTALPGPGTSSPVACGDKIFLTCYTGYGVNPDEPGKVEQLVRHLVCVSQRDGRILWDQPQKAKLPETEYSGQIMLHGYASSTPVTDGQTVYVFYGRSGASAYSIEGKLLWQADVGSGTDKWGSAASPIVYQDLGDRQRQCGEQLARGAGQEDRQRGLAGRRDQALLEHPGARRRARRQAGTGRQHGGQDSGLRSAAGHEALGVRRHPRLHLSGRHCP